jgi:hypothetical protein
VVRSHALRIFLAVVAASAIAAIFASSAAADISGPCTASIAGENVKGRSTGAFSTPITVEKDAIVPVTMSSAGQISYLKIEIEFAGTRWTVRDKPSHGSSWASSVDVKKYAKYGVGLYKVIGSSGGVNCSGTALVKVKGNPLSTVAGIVGLVAALAGLGGIGAAVALTMRAGKLGFGKTVLGAVFGLIAGLGLAVLLQEYAVMYPTLGAAIASVGLGGLFGIGLVFIAKLVGGSVAVPD